MLQRVQVESTVSTLRSATGKLFGRAHEVPDGEGLAAETAPADVPELDRRSTP
jgi:hypothetical protein